MLDSYAAALRAGWTPGGSIDEAAQRLRTIDGDPSTFLASLADRIGQEAADRSGQCLQLTRWMWDGEFCGEISLSVGAGWGGPSLSTNVPMLSCDIVPWKHNHDYEIRARRQLLEEVRGLGFNETDLGV